MYLRKSRQDDPNETVEEVLSKHEMQLQEHAKRELGYEIPEENIYREIVSGESIEEREEIKKVLARIEDPRVAGVIVIEPQRLSRGDLEDCGRLINDLRYTHTKVSTPMMTYDLEKKMDRKFFQDELLRGRDYLEYTKEILYRGRVAAVKRGCYINANPPYGYNRIKIGRDWTLEPNNESDVVKMIFDWYVNEGLTAGAIARKLNEVGVPASRSGEWARYTILTILDNIHYAGKVRFCDKGQVVVVEDGERIKRTLRRPREEVIIAEGKHEGLITMEMFEKAQNRRNDHPRIQYGAELVNPLAGVLRCKKCGRVMLFRQKKGGATRLICPTKPNCYKSAKIEQVISDLIVLLEHSNLPELEKKIRNGDGDAINIQKRRLANLTKQMQEYRVQEDKQYEFLETGFYSQERFNRQNAILRAKMEECDKQIYQARSSMPKNVNYLEKRVALLDAIAALKDDNMPVKERNRIIRKIVDKVDYTSTDGGLGVTKLSLEVTLKL
ncbi:MAG: recombinase family protein [Oscillospiraceae bacterium]|nr:recombinase family protein [Oscillospiraceae bacterium]